MDSLNIRKVRILQAIVNDYVLTTKPVGSERLIEIYHIGCKSATVRNEMAEMAEMGYLTQPHTSAGRIPTDRGYRYYVDVLMDPPKALDDADVQQAQAGAPQGASEIEEIIAQTCRVLTGLTSYVSLATDPDTDSTRVRHVYLSPATPRHVLLVMLLSTGHVEHRLVELETVPAEPALLRLSNYLNTLAGGLELAQIERTVCTPEVPTELAGYAALLPRLASALAQMANALCERRVFLEGTSQLLRQPEFQDVQRLETLLNALESRSALYEALRRALPNSQMSVQIGTENLFAPMRECSLVITTYRIGNRPVGYLGVVGPTRMNYDRAVAAVTLMAGNLSNLLTNLSAA